MSQSRIATDSYQALLLKLDKTYQFEKVDPKHRVVAVSRMLFNKFNQSRVKQGENAVDLSQLINPRGEIKAKFDTFMCQQEFDKIHGGKKVAYLNGVSSKPYQVTFFQGKLCDVNHCPIDSTNLRGKQNGFGAFALGKDGQVYFGAHVKAEFHHSSFTSGDDIMCSGMMKIENGKVCAIDNDSGHYKPKQQNLALMFYLLKCQNAFEDKEAFKQKNPVVKGVISLLVALHLYSPGAHVRFIKRSERFLKISRSFHQSKSKLLYWVAHKLDGVSEKLNYTADDFSGKAARYWEKSPQFRAAVKAINKKHGIDAYTSHMVLTSMGAGSPRLFHSKKQPQPPSQSSSLSLDLAV